MTIEAYLEASEDKTVEELQELTPEAYKGIADSLAINKAEQAIIDEVAGVDGDDEEQEKEELENEREMKTLFESLYEIDPETKEVFVKGSAYDLKKWEDDMVCFVFGDPERVVAMEAAISPAEHRLTQAYNRIEQKRTALAQIMRRHSIELKAKTISKAFAQDFQTVMGFPIPNVRMESFTTEPSTTNYQIAMEEMTGAQMAMAAGGALVGIGIIYKMIQWFARTLNKNGDATNSIGQNIRACLDRRERIKNAAYNLEISKNEINQVLETIKNDIGIDKINEADKGLGALKSGLSNQSAEQIYNSLSQLYLTGSLKGQMTKFMQLLIEGKLSQAWWNNLTTLSENATQAQIKLGGYIKEIAAAPKLPENKPDPVNFKFLDSLKVILGEMGINEGFTPYNESENNAKTCMESFVSAYQTVFTPIVGNVTLDPSKDVTNSFEHLDLKAFEKFTPEYIQNLLDVGKAIEAEVKQAHGETEKDIKDKTNNQDKDAKRQRLNLLVQEFKAISNILRFVINVRNQLGKLAVAQGKATERSESWIVSWARKGGQAIDKVTQLATDTANAAMGKN
jgi:hypothetical protein